MQSATCISLSPHVSKSHTLPLLSTTTESESPLAKNGPDLELWGRTAISLNEGEGGAVKTLNLRVEYVFQLEAYVNTWYLHACHDLAKQLSHFLFSFFNFLFLLFSWITTMKVKCGKGVTSLSQSHRMVTTHDRVATWQSNMRTVGDEVHSHNSSCIYSVENQMGTLLSSSCQLGLGVDLSCLG